MFYLVFFPSGIFLFSEKVFFVVFLPVVCGRWGEIRVLWVCFWCFPGWWRGWTLGRDPNCCCEPENVLHVPDGPLSCRTQQLMNTLPWRPPDVRQHLFRFVLWGGLVFFSRWRELTHWTRAARHHSDFFLLFVDTERKTSVEQIHVQTAAHTCEHRGRGAASGFEFEGWSSLNEANVISCC